MTNSNPGDHGVKVDLVSKERLDGLVKMEKVRLILDSVREGKVVILQAGLSPDEKSLLVEETMKQISPDEFSGITFEEPTGRANSSSSLRKRLGSIVGGGDEDSDSSMMVVASKDKLETLEKGDAILSTFITEDQ